MTTSPGFMHRGPISPRLHGTLDYPLAATLLTRFESDLEPASSVAIAPAAG
jgi:hypothetical protein